MVLLACQGEWMQRGSRAGEYRVRIGATWALSQNISWPIPNCRDALR